MTLIDEAVTWSDDFKFPRAGAVVEIDAVSYNKWVYEQLPFIKDMEIDDLEDWQKLAENAIKIGDNFSFALRRLPGKEMYSPWSNTEVPSMFWPEGSAHERRARLSIWSATSEAEVRFQGRPVVPILFKEYLGKWDVWMSLTPAEIITQRALIRRARGNVVIGGLGLGYLARRVLQRKQVKSVTVVEIDKAVADYFGKFLKDEFGKRVKIVKGDMYKFNWEPFDMALWDIWKGVADAPWDREFKEIQHYMKSAGKPCVGWTDWESRTS